MFGWWRDKDRIMSVTHSKMSDMHDKDDVSSTQLRGQRHATRNATHAMSYKTLLDWLTRSPSHSLPYTFFLFIHLCLFRLGSWQINGEKVKEINQVK